MLEVLEARKGDRQLLLPFAFFLGGGERGDLVAEHSPPPQKRLVPSA